MARKTTELSAQMKALKKTDLSPMIRMSGLIGPRLLNNFLPKLNQKQKGAFDKVMPVGGEKKFYVHLVGTPTPPIVIQMAQPLKMSIFSEDEVKKGGIKGLRFTVEDLQLAKEKKFGKFLWRIKGQIGTMMGLSAMAMPFIKLGPGQIKDMKSKAMIHFKPLMYLMPH
ncbi:MAG: hypothetical protein HGB14_04505 [Anaerolineaceae bacterium]|nr:hypothetical protein [Anaerolineaceae bacterium]